MEKSCITDPHHGGKETCHKCNGFIKEDEIFVYSLKPPSLDSVVFFHKDCFSNYEHYYGLDKPID